MENTLLGTDNDKIWPQGAGDYVLDEDPEATQINGAHMVGAVGTSKDNMAEEDAMTHDPNVAVHTLESSSSSISDLDAVFNDEVGR